MKKLFLLFVFLLSTLFFYQPVWAEASQTVVDPGSSLDFANGLYARKMYGPAISEYQKFIQENPTSPERASAEFRLADSYYFAKDYEQAIKNFQNFIKNFKDDKRVPVARFRIGTAMYNTHNYKGAESELFALAADAEDPTVRSGALFYLAKTYEAEGNGLRMTTVLKRLVANYPQTEYAAYSAFTLGEQFLKDKNYTESIGFFKNVADRTTPKTLADQAKYKLAEILFEQKSFKDARDTYFSLYESLKKDDKKDTTLLSKTLLGIFYSDSQIKNYEDAINLYRENQTLIDESNGRDAINYILSDIYSSKGENDTALQFLEKIIQDPSSTPSVKDAALFRKSRLLMESSKKEEALNELQKIIDNESKDSPRAYFEKGNLLFELSRFEEALPYYKMAAKETSMEYEKAGLYGLAMTQNKMGNRKDAHDNFLLLVQKFPKTAEAERSFLEAIQIDLDLENYREATKHSIQFLESYPDSALRDIGFYKLGMSLTGIDQFKEAAFWFEKIIKEYSKSPLYAEALYAEAASMDKAGILPAAISYYERFIKEYPDHSLYKDAVLRIGVVYMQDADFDKAASSYQRILQNEKDIEIDSKVAFWLIRYYLDKGKYADMQAILNLLDERYPKEDLSHPKEFFLGESALGAKNFDEALSHYSKAIELKLDGSYVPHSHLGKGIVYAVKENNEEALKSFIEATRFDSAVDVAARARFEIANIYLKQSNFQEAAKSFMLVAILYDDAKYSPLALLKASECFNQLGQKDEAQKALDELKTRYPNSEEAKV